MGHFASECPQELHDKLAVLMDLLGDVQHHMGANGKDAPQNPIGGDANQRAQDSTEEPWVQVVRRGARLGPRQ